jgi:hypothetical protein
MFSTRRRRTVVVISVVFGCFAAVRTFAGSAAVPDANVPHFQKQGKATQLIVDGKPFVMLAGELHNSSASSLDYMRGLAFGGSRSGYGSTRYLGSMHGTIWNRLVELGLNTVLATLSWELIEPKEGKFDFTLVDGLIKDARAMKLKLVFLWFGSWKNGVSSYTPPWVKKDLDRFPRCRRKDGRTLGVLSPLSDAACAADAKAFAAVMRRIREVDHKHNTVLMMQVENEAGLLGDSRDRSPLAEAAFAAPVPAELTDYLQKHKDSLLPETLKVWQSSNFKTSGTWAEVFGNDAWADEVFMAWHIGRYIGKIAEAGKREYPIPMYANAWLVQNEKQKPGDYPSGGPVSRMMDIWRAAAPAIDLLAPDIYLSDFKGVCESYVRSGNPLMIPEAGRGPEAAAKVFWAIAEHNAICFAPFGVENVGRDRQPARTDNPITDVLAEGFMWTVGGSPLRESYQLLTDLMPLITKYQGTGQMVGVLETDKEENRIAELGDYRAHISYKMGGKRDDQKGYGLILALAPDEFLLAGNHFAVNFSPKAGGQSEILELWEGRFEEGKWIPGRRLNGDENAGGWRTQLPPNYSDKFADPDRPRILRIKVFTHKEK